MHPKNIVMLSLVVILRKLRSIALLAILISCQETNQALFDESTLRALPANEIIEMLDDFDREQLVLAGRVWAESWSLSSEIMLASLRNTENDYAQLRIQHYNDLSWGQLPLWLPDIGLINLNEQDSNQTPFFMDWQADIDVESVPWAYEALISLGKMAFFYYPTQTFSALNIARRRNKPFNLHHEAEVMIGAVYIENVGDMNAATISLSCAACHYGQLENEDTLAWRVGKSNQYFNLGLLLDEETELITDRSAWGPGKVDVTADQQFNPVYISDLRPIRFQKTLHRAASLHNNLLSLASRIETLIITSLNQAYRPPRKLAFALALYLWSLGEALPKVSKLKSRFKEAWSILETECQSCHQGDDLAGEGVPIESVGTDPAVGQSSARGTGEYRIPSLRGVGTRGALMNDGSIKSFNDLLNPARQDSAHRFGLSLDAKQRDQLIQLLNHL